MNKRISLLLKEENLTAGKLADILEVQPSSISHLISGRNKPGFDFVAKLLERFPAISPDWLILGKGDMYRRNAEMLPFPEKDLSLPEFERFPTPGPLAERAERAARERGGEKRVERIVLFYSDHTFSVYEENEII